MISYIQLWRRVVIEMVTLDSEISITEVVDVSRNL